MPDLLVPQTSVLMRRVLVCITCLTAVVIFFRTQIGSGFALLSGDRFDGLIETTILEHWYNVFRGREIWNTTRFFFPAAGTLAYNDAYLVYGVIFTPFRLLGLDPMVSSELVNICIKAVGFISFYLLSRISYAANRIFAALGAALFTLSCTSYAQGHHVQLFSVAFAPLLILLVERHFALLSPRPVAAALLGCIAAAVLDLWLMTAFYMAWFTVFLVASAVLLGLAVRLVGGWRPVVSGMVGRCWPSALAAVVLVAGALPFLSLYLPKAAETGGHPWSETLSYLPSVFDIVNVGPDNLLFGSIDAVFNHAVRPDFPAYGEHTIGLPPALLILFALSLPGVRQRGILVLVTSLSCILVWTLALHVGTATLWHAIYDHIPGAKAVRVVCRVQILLVVPIILSVMAYLASISHRLPMPLLVILCAVLVLEQINVGHNAGIDRSGEMARLLSIPSPPADCKVFYVSAPRPGPPLYSANVDGAYSLNVDAMLLAETIDLPTINGMASFAPPGWALVDTHHPDYMERVRTYLALNHVEHSCDLDLNSKAWR